MYWRVGNGTNLKEIAEILCISDSWDVCSPHMCPCELVSPHELSHHQLLVGTEGLDPALCSRETAVDSELPVVPCGCFLEFGGYG